MASLGDKQTLCHKNQQNVPKQKILALELTTHIGVVRKVDKKVQKPLVHLQSNPSPVPIQSLFQKLPTVLLEFAQLEYLVLIRTYQADQLKKLSMLNNFNISLRLQDE